MWESQTIETVRIMLDDFVTPYKYSDNKIKKIIALSAKMVLVDTAYAFDYIIDVNATTITPDPVEDTTFLDLVCLKTACLFDHATTRDYSAKPSITIKEFQSSGSIDYKGAFDARMKILAVGWCKTYSDVLDSYLFTNNEANNGGIAVMSPFRLYGYSYPPR